MAYDAKKEKHFGTKTVQLGEEGVTAFVKAYNYDGGPKKVKVQFVYPKKDGGTITTGKFHGLKSKKDALAIASAITKLAKEHLDE